MLPLKKKFRNRK
ncbi:hypothetical protein Patl1_28055 [Pistacia atlantica]|uniref:Uncharacterized protein n=1 Tax=Pistacia atlantica TaxID=434234 RepID=A0ACC1BGE9_9ROSI|nr:hypothetical protein Patl1_28055 [Pistacia atlantica]